MLSIKMLEYVCLLSNMEKDKKKLLQIILLAQPELNEKLALPRLRQLNQRIAERFKLNYLTKTETGDYINHRLHVGGPEKNIVFTDGAIGTIYKYTKGCQRVINHICDRALLRGRLDETNEINKHIVAKAIESLRDSDPDSPGYFRSIYSPDGKTNRIRIAAGVFLILVIGTLIKIAIFNTAPPHATQIVLADEEKIVDTKSIHQEPTREGKTGEKNIRKQQAPILSDEDNLRDTISRWIEAWERRDLETYLSFYSPDFSENEKKMNLWKEKAKEIFDKYAVLAVEPQKLKIVVNENRGEVQYHQKFYGVYRIGGHYEDLGIKTLYLDRIDGDWKIIKELWETCKGNSACL